ncbi:MAG: aminotransferase class V-fold PLP-dependent enzyme [Treponemataceae bacterium]
MIYFDNAATTLIKPEQVRKLIIEGISSGKYGNPGRGSHKAALNALEEIYKTREALAKLFNLGEPENIALTQNGSASLNFVINSLFAEPQNAHIITTVTEHNSVLRPLYALEKKGLKLSFVGINEEGVLNYEMFENLIQAETKAIITTHASNVTGNKTDIERVYKIAKKHGLIFIVDASQTAGSCPIDISAFENSIFCFTGHKGLLGPGGTGVICVNGDFKFSQVFSGGSGHDSFNKNHPNQMPDIFEVGTINVPSFMGLRGGVEFILEVGTKTIEAKLNKLKQAFLKGLTNIPKLKIAGDKTFEKTSAIVSLNLAELSSSELSFVLDDSYEIATRPGAHCAPRLHEALGTKEQGLVRFSFSYFNTIEEINKALEVLETLAKKN